jgi:hypothetical protein
VVFLKDANEVLPQKAKMGFQTDTTIGTILEETTWLSFLL